MSKLNAKYLAGLFDGEGWISLRPQSQKRYLSSITIQVGIGMTNNIIEKIHKKFGGYLNFSKPKKISHKLCYNWSLQKKSLIKKFLKLIYPHLIVKKQQAKVMLKFIGLKTVSGRKRNPYLIKRAYKYINQIWGLNGNMPRKNINLRYGDVE